MIEYGDDDDNINNNDAKETIPYPVINGGGGSRRQRKCRIHKDEEEELGVTGSTTNCTAAADSGDLDTYGTNLGWRVRVLGGVLDTRS